MSEQRARTADRVRDAPMPHPERGKAQMNRFDQGVPRLSAGNEMFSSFTPGSPEDLTTPFEKPASGRRLWTSEGASAASAHTENAPQTRAPLEPSDKLADSFPQAA